MFNLLWLNIVYSKILVQRCDLTLFRRLYVSIQKLLCDYTLGLLKAGTVHEINVSFQHWKKKKKTNSCPLSWQCHPTISPSVTLFFYCPQPFPALGSFPMSWFSTSGVRSIGASVSVLPMNMQVWLPLGLTGLINVLSKGISRVFSSITVQKHQFLDAQSSLWSVQLSHQYMTTGKIIALTTWNYVDKVMLLFFFFSF